MPFTPINLDGLTSTPTKPAVNTGNDIILKDFGSKAVNTDSVINNLATKKGIVGKVTDSLSNLGTGIAKGVLSTLKGAGQLGEKLIPGVTPANSVYSEPALAADAAKGGFMGKLLNNENLKPQGTAQNIGKFTEQVGEFFIPAAKVNEVEKIIAGGAKTATLGSLTKLGLSPKIAEGISKAASLGTKMSVRAAEGGGIVGIQSGGDAKQTGTAAVVGGALPIAGPIISKTASTLTNTSQGILKRVAGALSGRGTAVIDEVLKNPRAAIEGLTGESLDTLSKDSRLLKETVLTMKSEAGKEYNRVINNLQSIYENEGKSFDKGTEINKISDLLEQKFGIVKSGKIAEQAGQTTEDAGKLDFESSRFLPKEATIIERALNIVKSFRDTLNPKTLEGLASKIDKLKSESPSAIETNSVIHTITSSLRNSVAQMGEEAGYTEGANLARNYAQALDKIDNINGLFRTTTEDLRPESVKSTAEISKIGETRKGTLGPIILPETEKTKIVQDLSTLFSGNKEIDKDILRKVVFGGQEILSRQAGRTLATATEKASTKLGDLIREAVIAPILPPKTIGKLAAYAKISTEKASKFFSALKRLDPAKRAIVIKLLTKSND